VREESDNTGEAPAREAGLERTSKVGGSANLYRKIGVRVETETEAYEITWERRATMPGRLQRGGQVGGSAHLRREGKSTHTQHKHTPT